MSKPSILLIPGAMGIPEFYQNVIDAVAAQGYEILGLHLPSAGLKTGPREGVLPTIYDDALFIAKETERLAGEGKDVILLAHSYGGAPTTESTKGLSKAERLAQGKRGGIVRIAYMTAIVPAIGENAGATLAGIPDENKLDLRIDVRSSLFPARLHTSNTRKEKGWMYHGQIPASAAICFSDIPAEEGEAWISKFVRQSSLSFVGELTHAGYKDIPVSYLLCEQDLCIPAATQRQGIALIEKVSGKKVDVTSIDAGHCPMVSQEKKVTEWILDVAKKV